MKHERIDLEKISTIFISHFHGDHFGGLPFFLISCLFEKRRESPLRIVGPPEIKERTLQLLDIMYPDTSEKVLGLDIHFLEYKAGKEIQIEDKYCFSENVEHSPLSNPHGIRLNWNEKVIGFSGDTSWTDNLIHLSKGSNIFICESNFLNNMAYGHLCYTEIVERMEQLDSQKILLSHLGEEMLAFKNSELELMYDGMVVEF